MHRENHKTSITLLFIILFLANTLAQNRATITPAAGTIHFHNSCTLEVTSEIPVDSVAFSVEYRSPRGMIRKKSIGTVTNPPFSIILNTKSLKNQYFFGANAIADIYRKDDTLQIINSPRLFFLPDSIERASYSLFPSTYIDAPTFPLTDTSLSGIKVTRETNGITVSFDLPGSKVALNDNEGITIVLDPLLTRSPFPGNDAVILFVPFSGDPQLITSAENGANDDFSIARTGTKISLDKQLTRSQATYSGRITVPDFLLGGAVPDSIGLNVIIPYATDTDYKQLSFVAGEEFMLYSPILFPTFTIAEAPVEVVSPYPYFGGAFLVGFFLMAIVFVIRRSPPTVTEVSTKDSDLLTAIENSITDQELSIDFLSSQLKRSAHQLNRECVRMTGKKVPVYIQWARIEIVKERLVSSNASEISIAKECGFRTVADMENGFHNITGIAPYQFREKNGIK